MAALEVQVVIVALQEEIVRLLELQLQAVVAEAVAIQVKLLVLTEVLVVAVEVLALMQEAQVLLDKVLLVAHLTHRTILLVAAAVLGKLVQMVGQVLSVVRAVMACQAQSQVLP